jgi:hypothetical protein
MDKRKIEEILNQLVVWAPQDPVDDRMQIRDREQTKRQLFSLGYSEDEIEEALDEVVHDSRMVVNGVNITIPKTIKAIKHQPKLCELNCGQMVINQKIERSWHSWPEPHWRTKCTNCQHYLHPNGKELVKGINNFKSYYSKKKR